MMETLFNGIDAAQLSALAAALVAAGIVAGLIAGLFGVGGGIVIVPALYFLFSGLGFEEAARMHVAVGTSLTTIIATGLVATRSHYKRGAVDMEVVRTWLPWILVGVLVGAALAAWTKGPVLRGIFLVFALYVATRMIKGSKAKVVRQGLPGPPWGQVIPVLNGAFSAMVGIGGGTITVPVLSACAYEARRAVGTASAIGVVIAVPGSLGFMVGGWNDPALPPLSLGYVNLLGIAAIVPMTILFAPLGARLAHKLDPDKLKKGFAVFVFLVGSKMLLESLGVAF